MDTLKFTESLIKGRIAETIFEMMFGHLEGYSLAHFGIEYTSPTLINQEIRQGNRELLDRIGDTPDFVEVDSQNKVTLVEVKYRKSINPERVKEIAEKVSAHWPEAALFLVTPEAFYFDRVTEIIQKGGVISSLSPVLVSQETQQEYLGLLKRFGLKDVANGRQ